MSFRKGFHLKKIIVLLFVLQTLAASSLRAQDASGNMLDDSIQDMTVVLGSGLFGAIMGLSTLSFVDRPADHLKNISMGGAIGVIIGVSIVIFSQANRSVLSDNHSMLPSDRTFLDQQKWAYFDHLEWQKSMLNPTSGQKSTIDSFQLKFTF